MSFGRDRLAHPRLGVLKMDYEALVQAIDRQNAEWVEIARRFSYPLLVDFLALTDPQLYAYFKALPSFGASGPPVSWAGDTHSPNWFDIAREYTEKWLHQQHIRQAVGHPLLDGREWLFPVLDTFLPRPTAHLPRAGGRRRHAHRIPYHRRGGRGLDTAARAGLPGVYMPGRRPRSPPG